MTQGDINGNLDKVLELEDALVVDPTLTTLNCQLLSQNNFLRAVLGQTWEDVRDYTSVTTDLVEQGHGTGAVLVKLHDLLEMDMLQDRSILHQCRFLSKPSQMQVALDKRNVKINTLVSKSRQKTIGARHVLMSQYLKRENASQGRKKLVKHPQGFAQSL